MRERFGFFDASVNGTHDEYGIGGGGGGGGSEQDLKKLPYCVLSL